MNAQQLSWLVGSPPGIRTRVCCDTTSGAHPFTPELVRQRYATEIRNAALVVWHLSGARVAGVRAGVDEVAWHDADIAYFETSFCRPAKGSGYVCLAAQYRDGQTRAILSSDQYDSTIYEWHLAAATLLQCIYPGFTRTRDDGFDA